eukprot:CAMPEP_0119281456 /NCGR_PEP_ID=MMETSP1329-20130426/24744_1 /TAXON_ID=114041 /ORGANISM="Genus nov. species nov., Strain RCC1024" /LENGTH=198 /DNA_ID=CAMNT_0007282075 /DNA_START=221 /DNA_END=814 /DNA_ORIENTATION=-
MSPAAEAPPGGCLCVAWSGAGRPLAMMAALGFLWGGACFGFNGIKRVLLDEGIFASVCAGKSPCAAQLEHVDAAWTFSSSMLNVFALANGAASDALGLRRVCFLSAGLLTLGTAAFAAVVSAERYEHLLEYAYFALVESGMLLSFGGLSLQGEEGAVRACGRPLEVRVAAAPVMETAFALGTLVFPALAAVHGAVPGA